MMKNKKTLLIISGVVIAIIVAAVTVIKIQEYQATKDWRAQTAGYTVDPDIEDDLKNNLGKGTAGDVIDVQEGTDSEGNRTYTYTFSNGATQVVTIRHDENGSGVLPIDELSPDDKDNDGKKTEDKKTDKKKDKKKKNKKKKDNKKDDNKDDEGGDTPSESPGTVYERFYNMSGADQMAFICSFKSPEAFFKWLDSAEKEYVKLHPSIVIGEGDIIDFGK